MWAFSATESRPYKKNERNIKVPPISIKGLKTTWRHTKAAQTYHYSERSEVHTPGWILVFMASKIPKYRSWLPEQHWLSRLLHTFLRSFSTPRLTHNGYEVADRHKLYPDPSENFTTLANLAFLGLRYCRSFAGSNNNLTSYYSLHTILVTTRLHFC